MQTYEDPRNGKSEAFRPIIGVYTCLLCEQIFSTKSRLKRHYCRGHEESIPNYEGVSLDMIDSTALEINLRSESN